MNQLSDANYYAVSTSPERGIGNIMISAQKLQADLKTHHIEGFAREGNKEFSCPLITPIDDNFWQGGCVGGVNLQGFFDHIISLYPWERYNPGKELATLIEARLFDGPTVPDETQLYTLARYINFARTKGRVLVHCQAGLNRSGLLSGLALILGGMAPADAIAKLRNARSQTVLCNKAFESWLLQQGVKEKLNIREVVESCSSPSASKIASLTPSQ